MKRPIAFLFFLIPILSLQACNPFTKKEETKPVSLSSVVPSVAPTLPPPPPATLPAAPVIISNNPSLVGTYHVRGTNPGGRSNYHGTATLSSSEKDVYKIHWQVGTVYDGEGKLEGNTLNVKWGTPTAPVGTVVYTLEAGGILKGVWYTNSNPNALGSEILTPK